MIDLFPHNQTAYEAAERLLRTTGKAAVIHPTGTGKSFIGFRLCEVHPDSRVLWLSPSAYIFDTQIENLRRAADGYAPENITFLTYAKLMLQTDAELAALQPDYIILDEFHRCGAEQWGAGVQRLLSMYLSVPILGLSATAIRYLDNQRDMAEELFGGNIASEISLGEAIVRGILRAPKYVLTAYSYQKDFERYERRIRSVRNAAARDRADRELEALRRALDMADGLPEIFGRHMQDKRGKYLVFCAGAEHMREMISAAPEWFAQVDTAPHIYSAYSNDPETSQAFADFKADESDHLKLLYCIDMLNEGVHVENVSGVILLRPTISPIVYKQQIGRAMAVGQAQDAVIFDVVMNIANLQSVGAIQDEMNRAMDYYRSHGEGDRIVTEHFRVWDELRSCRELFASLDRTLSSSWELMYALAREYYETNGNLNIPYSYTTPEGYPLGTWLSKQKDIRKGTARGVLTEDQIRLLDEIGMSWDGLIDGRWNVHFTALCTYHEAHGDVNVPYGYVTPDGVKLGQWIKKLRSYKASSLKMNYLTPERIAALDRLGMIWDKTDHVWERNYQAAADYYRVHGSIKMPQNYKTADGIGLGRWLKHTQDIYRDSMGSSLTTSQKERLEALGVALPSKEEMEQKWQSAYAEARQYFHDNGHLNVPLVYKTASGFGLGRWLAHERTIAAQNTNSRTRPYPAAHRAQLDSIQMIWERQKMDSWMEYYKTAERYYAQHHDLELGRMDVFEDVWLGDWLIRQRHARASGKLSAERIELLDKLHFDWEERFTRQWEDTFRLAEQFYLDHGHLSVPQQIKWLYIWLVAQRDKREKGKLTPEQIQKLDSIGMKWEKRGSEPVYPEARGVI